MLAKLCYTRLSARRSAFRDSVARNNIVVESITLLFGVHSHLDGANEITYVLLYIDANRQDADFCMHDYSAFKSYPFKMRNFRSIALVTFLIFYCVCVMVLLANHFVAPRMWSRGVTSDSTDRRKDDQGNASPGKQQLGYLVNFYLILKDHKSCDSL